MASFGDAGAPLEEPPDITSAINAISIAIRQLGHLRPSPSPFWEPFLSAESRIVLGRFDSFNDFEASGLLGVGDAICLTEVAAGLRGRYGTDVPVRYADRLDGDDLGCNLILIGGPDANSATRDVLSRIPTGIRFGDPGRHEVSLYSNVSRTPFIPERDDNGELCVDYGVILRAPNPFASRRNVVALFGCFGFGTWAAGRSAHSDAFLLNPVAAKGGTVECIVRTEILRGVPQQATVCEIRELPT
jgi:hypothetical protein